jgi:hypothetical protein
MGLDIAHTIIVISIITITTITIIIVVQMLQPQPLPELSEEEDFVSFLGIYKYIKFYIFATNYISLGVARAMFLKVTEILLGFRLPILLILCLQFFLASPLSNTISPASSVIGISSSPV